MEATLDPHDGTCLEDLEAALKRYGSDPPTWATTRAALYLGLLGGDPKQTSRRWPNRWAARCSRRCFAFYRAVPYYMRDDDATAAGLARAGRRPLPGRRCRCAARDGPDGSRRLAGPLADATTVDVFDPLLESLELWERLRIPWGRVAITEEVAQALAIRGHPEQPSSSGAQLTCRIQAPSKVGRARRTRPLLADVPAELSETWRRRGLSMTLDEAVLYARRVLIAELDTLRPANLAGPLGASSLPWSSPTSSPRPQRPCFGDRAWRVELDEHDRAAMQLATDMRATSSSRSATASSLASTLHVRHPPS